MTWPYDAANAHAALENALALVEQDPNLTSGQRATFENELAADMAEEIAQLRKPRRSL